MFLDLKIEDFNGNNLSASDSEIHDYKSRNSGLTADIEKYLIDKTNILNVTNIEEHLFPKTQIDVFISHSHADENEAIALAIALEKLGLSVFVDSCVWGHADELLFEVDKHFSADKTKQNSYFYQLRNRTTANVHMILNCSLQAMIDNSELLIFLDTENSVSVQDMMKEEKYLSSPWIFSELIYARRTRRTPRRQTHVTLEHAKTAIAGNENLGARFHYELPKLTANIASTDFHAWLNAGPENNKNHIIALQHLDRLYKKAGVAEKELAAARVVTS